MLPSRICIHVSTTLAVVLSSYGFDFWIRESVQKFVKEGSEPVRLDSLRGIKPRINVLVHKLNNEFSRLRLLAQKRGADTLEFCLILVNF